MKFQFLSLLGLTASALALHPHSSSSSDDLCVAPGVCEPPSSTEYTKFGRTAAIPRKQWGDSGGFCGSLSIQVIGLSYGVYHSQDSIRKCAPKSDPLGHGDDDLGYEILHSNIEPALDTLGYTFNSWDWENQVQPQGKEYLQWMKDELVGGGGIVQFVICKGDGHNSYGSRRDPVPYDHIEPFFALYSKNSTAPVDPESDLIVHGSDYSPDGEDNFGYLRNMGGLLDSLDMDGNCDAAQAGYGKNEMYPCIYEDLTYGYSITGLKVQRLDSEEVAVFFDEVDEPDVRSGETVADLHANVIIPNAVAGVKYNIERYDGVENFPASGSGVVSTTTVIDGVDGGITWADPTGVPSDTSTMYVVTKAE
ncbi:hypothetical protein TrST_g9702 [Triparma strigata]|uniref:Peptidase C1A papain C-terminal domain-containing protein n=1 Tax=Triparma strigata TaxID=1606541 RepID=A0A9W7DVY3_9STRA|nr:hypothetical protein TrST_g9702 [Triparma strigata]